MYTSKRPKFANALLLKIACEKGDEAEVIRLISKGKYTNTDLDRALRIASQNGYLSIAHLLIKQGADVSSNNNYAIRWASNAGHTEIVHLLIQHGANVNAEESASIEWASQRGHFDTVKVLIEHGANIYMLNPIDRRTALGEPADALEQLKPSQSKYWILSNIQYHALEAGSNIHDLLKSASEWLKPYYLELLSKKYECSESHMLLF